MHFQSIAVYVANYLHVSHVAYFILLKTSNLARQMEHSPNPLDLFHISIWVSAHSECLIRGDPLKKEEKTNRMPLLPNKPYVNHTHSGPFLFTNFTAS